MQKLMAQHSKFNAQSIKNNAHLITTLYNNVSNWNSALHIGLCTSHFVLALLVPRCRHCTSLPPLVLPSLRLHEEGRCRNNRKKTHSKREQCRNGGLFGNRDVNRSHPPFLVRLTCETRADRAKSATRANPIHSMCIYPRIPEVK
ncbi:hypothetical protein Zmor_019352 [Zophobas morio]|uniref:Uncharacterized protein n=1 Tax=Zophobas morio TaxID=2755281 RepID=A0AA38I5R0_9CUCU|nr:hypothetical protein Zmor_019352 [Zophobas morio]